MLPLAVPADELARASRMLDVLHQVERAAAGSSVINVSDKIEALLAGIDPVEVRETQVILAAFAALNRKAAA
jgi:hypothetical protein